MRESTFLRGKMETTGRMTGVARSRPSRERPYFPFLSSIFHFRRSQNVAAQVLVLHNVHELLVDVRGVNFNVLFLEVRRLERDFIKNFLEYGVQAARADIFGLLVDAGGKTGDRGDGIFGEIQLHALGLSSAAYCLISAFFGSVRIRMKSSSLRDCSSTRMGKRP